MKKLFKRLMALSICACMMVGMTVSASADTGNKYFTVRENGFYLNMLASTPSAVTNGTEITTWNTRDTSGTQDFTVSISPYSSNYNLYTMYLRGSSSMVMSYNRVSSKPVMWEKDNDNPYTEYTIYHDFNFSNQPIGFYFISGEPSLVANGSRVTYGSQYGYRVNTITNLGAVTDTNTQWNFYRI